MQPRIFGFRLNPTQGLSALNHPFVCYYNQFAGFRGLYIYKYRASHIIMKQVLR